MIMKDHYFHYHIGYYYMASLNGFSTLAANMTQLEIIQKWVKHYHQVYHRNRLYKNLTSLKPLKMYIFRTRNYIG